jgi:hypothetical protein
MSGLGAAGRLMTINEVDINTVPKRALMRARISRRSRPNGNRHPNFRDMRKAVILEFGRCPLLPHLQHFTGVVVRMLLRIRAGVLSVAIHFATFDTKRSADWRAAR